MIRSIKLIGDPILTTPAETFNFADPPCDPTELAMDLIETMNHHRGIGLAANQIGVPYRVFVMRAETPFVCFNPRIVMPSTEQIALDESCLSIPGLVAKITRPRHIKVRFQTPTGITVTKEFTGMTARCFLHEMMHLNGKYFFEGIGRLKMEKSIKEAKKRGFDYASKGLMKHAISTE